MPIREDRMKYLTDTIALHRQNIDTDRKARYGYFGGIGWGTFIEGMLHFSTLDGYINSNETFTHYLLRSASEHPFWESIGILCLGAGIIGASATTYRIRKANKQIKSLEKEIFDL